MTHISIQEILGSDNVAASRSVINSNNKVFADSVNKIYSHLDVFNAGGKLEVANVLISRLNNTIDINHLAFKVEASAEILGKLVIGNELIISGKNGLSIGNGPLNINGVLNIEKSIEGTTVGTSNISSRLMINDLLALKVTDIVVTMLPSNRHINVSGDATDSGKSFIKIIWDKSVKQVVLRPGVEGQILIINNGGDPAEELRINNLSGMGLILFKGKINASNIDRLSAMLIFDNGEWRVLSSINPVEAAETFYYVS